jgi:hypothetical protein
MSTTHAIEGFVSGLVKQFSSRNDSVYAELDRLGGIRRRTLSMVENLTEEQASFAPTIKAWSVAQNLDHIVLFEDLYRGAIQKLIDLGKQGKKPQVTYTLKDIDVSLSALPEFMLKAMEAPLNMMNPFIPSAVRQAIVRFPILSANTPQVAAPRTGLKLSTLRTQLAESASVTRDLLSAPLPANPREMAISHPVLGINNVIDLLGMMCAHEERHQDQIQRILDNPGLPAAV